MATATARGGAAGSAGAGTALGYSLGLAASVLYLGAVGDHYGRRMMLAAAVLLSGGQWAYAAAIIGVVLGAALVYFMFPRQEAEIALLRRYQAADSQPGAG